MLAAVHQFLLHRGHRRDPAHAFTAAWSLLAASFVFGVWLRFATDSPAVFGLAVRLQYTVALLAATVGIALGHAATGRRASRAHLVILAGTALVALVPWTGEVLVGPGAVMRTDVFGDPFPAPRWGPGMPLFVPYALVTGAWAVHLGRSGPPAEAAQRRPLLVLGALLGPASANDMLLDAGILPGFRLFDMALAVHVLAIVRSLADRSGALRAGLEKAVAAYTLESRSRQTGIEAALASVRGIIDALPDPVIVYSNSRIRFVNRAVGPRLGWAPDRLVGRLVTDLAVPERVSETLSGFLDLERSPAPSAPREQTLVRGDGRRILCEVVGLAFGFEGERAAVAMLRDVTERRAAQAQLRRADRLASVGTLAAGVARDLEAPLAELANHVSAARAGLASMGVDDPGLVDANDCLREAEEGTARIRRIAKGLQTFARPEGSTPCRLSLQAPVDLAITMAENEIRHRARLIRESGPVPDVVGDEAQLAHVVLALLVNAAHAVPEGDSDRHRIRISTRSDGRGRALIEVADSGPGIPEGIRDRVFDPFFTTKRVGIGTGLGLATCHGIVAAMGGEIWIGDAPEGGALVRVLLPAAQPVEADAGPERARVLVVDDDVLVAKAMQRLLPGHHVHVARSGREALGLCERETFDLVVCDVMMPGVSGVEVFERLCARDRAWRDRFVFVTAGAFGAETLEALERTGVPTIAKPLDPTMLETIVRGKLRRA